MKHRLVIVDSSVIFFAIVSKLKGKEIAECHIKELIRFCFLWVNSLAWVPNLAGAKVIWVEDKKPYWRDTFYPDYKKNRQDKPELFPVIVEVFEKMSQQTKEITSVGFHGYEADDVAAAIVRLHNQDQLIADQILHINLVTVDSDWLGMVFSKVTWVNTAVHEPRVRKLDDVYEWLRGKWSKQSKKKQRMWSLPDYTHFTPQQIWEWKAVTGDKADNIDASAKHVIDLFNPPKVYDILEDRQSAQALTQAIKILLLSPVAPMTARQKHELFQAIYSFGVQTPVQDLVYPMEYINNELISY